MVFSSNCKNKEKELDSANNKVKCFTRQKQERKSNIETVQEKSRNIHQSWIDTVDRNKQYIRGFLIVGIKHTGALFFKKYLQESVVSLVTTTV